MEDNDGVIWVGTDNFLSRYNPVKKIYKHFTVKDGLVNNFVYTSIQDTKGNLWFGTKGGVSRYNKKDGTFLNFTTKQGLADNQVESITEDDAGSLWFSTYGGGVSRYDGPSVIDYATKQGLPGKAVYAITEDTGGNLWLSPGDGGIVEYRRSGPEGLNGTFINYTTAQGFPAKTASNAIEDDEGNLWFGTFYGLCKFDGTSFTTYTTKQGLSDDYITALYKDRNGNLWIGTYNGGVSIFDGEKFTNFSTAQGLVHKTVWNFLEDKDGIIWIATRGGLSRYDGTYFMNFTTAQGLPDNKLSIVMQDSKGNILIGSWGGGISVIRKKYVEKLSSQDAQQPKKSIYEHLSTANGLANDIVYGIIEDHSGNIIIGSSYGFTVLRGGISDQEGTIAKEDIENYNEKTGYPIKDVSNNYSMYQDRRGLMWAGTVNKLVRFDYSSVHKSKKPPAIFIQDVNINKKPLSWRSLQWARNKNSRPRPKHATVPAYVADELLRFGRKLTPSERDSMVAAFKNVRFDSVRAFTGIPENLVLPYADNNIGFNFIGVETTRPGLVRYRYKLEGYDENWSPVTGKTSATFGHIFEGNYTFEVQARSSDGVWSAPVTYHFKILPPWYRTWWAYLFYGLIFLGILYLFYRMQKRRTIRIEREKTQQKELEQARKIEKAYRELEIEAALEKVRGAGMAMHHTSELQDVVNTVARQLQKINININGGVFIIINDEIDNTEDSIIWGSGGAADYMQKAVIPFLDRPIFTRLCDAIRKREDFLVERYTREEKIEFFKHLFKYSPWNSTPRERKKQLLSLPGGYARSATISSHTSLFIINNTGKTFSEEDNEILKRFGNVFEQSYTRFLDLQKAEQQASLDRIRAEIASMRSTEDLQRISQIVFDELTALGVPFIRCGIFIIDEVAGRVQAYLSAPDGRSLGVLNLSADSSEFIDAVVKAWQKGVIYQNHWSRDDFVRWTMSMKKMGQIRDEYKYQGNEAPPESLDLHFIPFPQGMLYVGNDESLNQNQLALAQNLADAFAVAYARYDDFNQLEQAKKKVEVALSELQSTQEQLVQQEKLASLGQLTAGIAHEIKNPLNFVNNFSEVSMELIDEVREELSAFSAQQSTFSNQQTTDGKRETPSFAEGTSLKEGGARAKAKTGDVTKQPKSFDVNYTLSILNNIEANLRKIHEHGHRADDIVKSMLQHSRKGSGAMEPVDLNKLVREFVNLTFHGMWAGKNPFNVDIELDLDETVGQVPLIAEDFSRVMVNLCNNAFDAMREKLAGLSDRGIEYHPTLTVKTCRGNEQIIVEIEDNGPGIPSELKDKILQPFFTTKKGIDGTGLGLSITRDIVKAHVGVLKIRSQLGHFTRFIIKLPTKMS